MILAIVLASAITCGPTTQPTNLDDPWFQEEGPTIDGNLDKAEARWRKEIERDRVDDANKRNLMDDPPTTEADELDSEHAQGEEVTKPSFWTTVGKTTFAAVTVLVTLGMMAAPYLLMI